MVRKFGNFAFGNGPEGSLDGIGNLPLRLLGSASGAAMAVGLGLMPVNEAWAVNCFGVETAGADNFICDVSSGGLDWQAGNDTISFTNGVINAALGGEGDDSLTVNGATLTVNVHGDGSGASSGNDTIRLISGSVGGINAGANDDLIVVTGGSIANQITASGGDDSIAFNGGSLGGGAAGGTLFAGNGDDTITLNAGTVAGNVFGRNDNDSIDLNGTSVGADLAGDNGNDTIHLVGGTVGGDVDGGNGDDIINLDDTGGGDTVPLSLGGDILGGLGGDTIELTTGNFPGVDVFGDDGLGGGATGTADDSIRLFAGATVGAIDGEGGDDTIVILNGSAGAITGGSGADDLQLTNGTIASIDGGTEDDTILLRRGSVAGDVTGGDNDDEIFYGGGAIDGDIRGGAGDDSITINDVIQPFQTITLGGDVLGDGGSDTITLTDGDLSSSDIDGGAEADQIIIEGGMVDNVLGNTGSDTITMSAGVVTDRIALGDLAGTTNDADFVNMTGGSVGNGIIGDAGADSIQLLGGTVSANVFGNDGNDTVILGEGMSLANVGSILGGAGTDFIRIEVADGGTRTFAQFDTNTFENILVRNDTDSDAAGTLNIAPTSATFGFNTGAGPLAGTTFQASGPVTINFVNASGDNMIRAETVTFDEGTMLTGEGTISSTDTFFNGGVAPGNSPGIIENEGNATFGAASFFHAEFDDIDASLDIETAARGTEFDGMDVTDGGNLDITAGATLIVDFLDDASTLTGLADGDQFEIFQLTGGGAISGDFSLIITPASLVSGLEWRTFTTATAYGIELVEDVPEPVTTGAFGAALASLWGLRRRRKSKARTQAQ